MAKMADRQQARGSIFAEDIARAAHRLDDTMLSVGLDFLAQVAHIDLDNIALAAEVIAPDAVVDHLAGENLVGVAHKEVEQIVLFCGEFNATVADA